MLNPALMLRRLSTSVAIVTAATPHAASTPAPPRRLWVLPQSAELVATSPDGRYVSYTDWNQNGDLVITDLTSSATHNVSATIPRTTQGVHKDYAAGAVFSPDGSRIAYGWSSSADELRIANVDGSDPHTLVKLAKTDISVDDWTPDGLSILAHLFRAEDNVAQLALVSAAGGAPRILKTFPDWRTPTSSRISPDGRFIAFAYPTTGGDHGAEIDLLSLETGRITVLVKRPTNQYPVGWTTDGAHLAFISDRAGSPGLWSLAVVDGRPRGDARLLRGDLWHATGLRLGQGSRLFYTVHSGDRDIVAAPFDAERGVFRAPPASMTNSPGEPYGPFAWSTDAKYFAFGTLEGNSDYTPGARSLTLRPVDAAQTRRFRPRVGDLRAVRWIPGTRALMLLADDDKGQLALQRFDLSTGDITPVVAPVKTNSGPAFSSDGKIMYYVANARLHEHDLATGRERELYSFPSGQTGSVFAVAQQAELVVLVVRRQALIVVSTTTGAARTIGGSLAVDAQTQVIPDGLLPDGRNLLVTTRRGGDAGQQTLWRVPLDGGAAESLGSPKELARGTTPGLLSPDGRELLFAAGTVSSELWVLDANARTGQLSSSGSR